MPSLRQRASSCMAYSSFDVVRVDRSTAVPLVLGSESGLGLLLRLGHLDKCRLQGLFHAPSRPASQNSANPLSIHYWRKCVSALDTFAYLSPVKFKSEHTPIGRFPRRPPHPASRAIPFLLLLERSLRDTPRCADLGHPFCFVAGPVHLFLQSPHVPATVNA